MVDSIIPGPTPALVPTIVPAPTYVSKFDAASVASFIEKDIATIPEGSKNAAILFVDNNEVGVAVLKKDTVNVFGKPINVEWSLKVAKPWSGGAEAKAGVLLHW